MAASRFLSQMLEICLGLVTHGKTLAVCAGPLSQFALVDFLSNYCLQGQEQIFKHIILKATEGGGV